ncbi:MAG: hypothetical protein A2096_02050 [Spirochaetes bacterium GWF1_41_5]|nr:MAG: hypothetical protein A2096_02050 [Spirochaetes bacterium GWF1_41_5]HBE01730.1 hypothetical protein [Spirochaetia bacterium]
MNNTDQQLENLKKENGKLLELAVLNSTVLDQLSALIKRILACEKIGDILEISITYIQNLSRDSSCLLLLEENGKITVSNRSPGLTGFDINNLLAGSSLLSRLLAEKKETVTVVSEEDAENLLGSGLKINRIICFPLAIPYTIKYFGSLLIFNMPAENIEIYLYFIRIIAQIIITAINNHRVTESLAQSLKSLQEYQSRLLQEEKMATIGQLAAGIAHEINNPIAFIKSNLISLEKYSKMFISLIKEYENVVTYARKTLEGGNPLLFLERLKIIENLRKEDDIDWLFEDIKPLLNDSIEGTVRIKEIVENLKNFSHVDTGKISMVNLNQNIQSTLRIIYNELKYKADLKEEYGELPLLACHAQQLSQVFLNVFTNAIQSIESKGEISIKTRCTGTDINIIISDTGCGIPHDIQSRIFEPFFTTKPVGKGTGLGLHICYTIIKEHKGTISVQSEPGKGSAFTVVLPLDNGLSAG